MEKIIAIHDVQHIDVTVDSKVRIQRKAEHPMVSPFTDLVMDVEQERIVSVARIFEPDLAASLPNIDAFIIFECDSDGIGPWSGDNGFGKSGRHRRCQEIAPKGQAPCHQR
jgi:hypothetical protein